MWIMNIWSPLWLHLYDCRMTSVSSGFSSVLGAGLAGERWKKLRGQVFKRMCFKKCLSKTSSHIYPMICIYTALAKVGSCF